MFSGRLRISVAEESRRKTGAARVLAAAKAFLPTIPPQLIMTEPTEEREGGRGYLDGNSKHKHKNDDYDETSKIKLK